MSRSYTDKFLFNTKTVVSSKTFVLTKNGQKNLQHLRFGSSLLSSPPGSVGRRETQGYRKPEVKPEIKQLCRRRGWSDSRPTVNTPDRGSCQRPCNVPESRVKTHLLTRSRWGRKRKSPREITVVSEAKILTSHR